MSLSTIRFGAIYRPVSAGGGQNAIKTQKQAAYFTAQCFIEEGGTVRLVQQSDGDYFVLIRKHARELEEQLENIIAPEDKQPIIDAFLKENQRRIKEIRASKSSSSGSEISTAELFSQISEGFAWLAEQRRLAGD